MSILSENEIRSETVIALAKKMMLAARTAPKGRGVDNLLIALADKEAIKEISNHMKLMAEEGRGAGFFIRDAENILLSEAIVLIGTKISAMGLKQCGLCGFKDCEEKNRHPKHPCSFNTGDLGIAIGSAVSIACDARIDNRIMFSVGKAAKEMNLLGEEAAIIYAIPLSASAKNPFFDRK